MSLDIRLPRLHLLLRQLRLPTVAANYARYAQEASQSGQRYEEYLLALLNEEVSQRDINRRKRLIREARFPVLRTPRVRGGGFQRYPKSEQNQGTATG